VGIFVFSCEVWNNKSAMKINRNKNNVGFIITVFLKVKTKTIT